MPTPFAIEGNRVCEDVCFVLIPFKHTFDNTYATVKSIVEDFAGLKCVRADDIARPDRITDDIYRGIQSARVIAADLTGHNPNVFYELGLSHALGKYVILLAQEGTALPFDVASFRHLFYSPNSLEQFRRGFGNFLAEALRKCPVRLHNHRTFGSPDVRIVKFDSPKVTSACQPIRLRVAASNLGDDASEVYLTLSFPSGVTGMRIVESDLQNRIVGLRGQPWKGQTVILEYDLAEVWHDDSSRPWLSGAVHFMEVEVVPNRRGLNRVYASSSCRMPDGSFRHDPASTFLLDQRDEPVYCEVVEVV